MGRSARQLFDIEIDEVSIVDRPANQHGLISFAKSAHGMTEESGMTAIYNEAGYAVSEDQLEHGDVVYDEAGNEYVFMEEPVGKNAATDAVREWGQRAVERAGHAEAFAPHGAKARRAAGRAAIFTANNPKKAALYGGGALAGVGAGGSVAYGEAKKSLGDQVLEELSKAVTEADREEVIAKALDRVTELEDANWEITKALEAEQDARITEAFISKASEYNLPVDPVDLGLILKSAAEVLTDEQLEVLDELFNAVGDALYEEIGFQGGASNSGVLDEVNGYAAELVGKSAGSLSLEQAAVAMFEANPGAYDAYLNEMGR
jgi:hypothetical protein